MYCVRGFVIDSGNGVNGVDTRRCLVHDVLTTSVVRCPSGERQIASCPTLLSVMMFQVTGKFIL